MLIEVKKFLESSEEEMVKRWATGKATNTMIGLIIAGLMMSAFSYRLGIKLVPSRWQSTMVLEVKSTDEPESNDLWLAQQQKALTDERILTETTRQLDKHGVHSLTSVPVLGEHLAQHLTITGQPPNLLLTYRANDNKQAVAVLEAVGDSYLKYRMAADRAQNRTETTRIIQAVSRTEIPTQKEQLKVTGIALGSMATMVLLLLLVFRLLLSRTQRVFDPQAAPELSVLEQPDA